ncbi:type II toxin-antitoxin system Phd/YefM family antitoxin [Nitrospira sp. Nam74]
MRDKAEIVNIYQAKTHLSQLIAKVAAGHRFIIAKGGTPIAQLTPLDASIPARHPGFLKGKITIAPDFDAALPSKVVHDFERDL